MEINIWQVLFQAINFGVILLVLNKILYKPVMKLLDDRAKKINDGMVQADKNLKQAEEAEKLKKAEITKARKEASAIIRAAEADAKKQADEVIAKAKAKAKDEAERIIKNAESEVVAKNKALEAQVAELAVAMAQQALAETITKAEADKITKSMLAKLK